MYRLNETFFQTYWDAMSASTPMIDWDTMEYAEWSIENNRYYGCRSLSLSPYTANGIVRKIDTDDYKQVVSVIEASMNKYGGAHGFYRNIFYKGTIRFIEL